MIANEYEADVTLEINDVESDFEVKGRVELEMTSRGWRAVIDGPVEVRCRGDWEHLDEVRGLSAGSRERALAALEEIALEDDSCAEDGVDDDCEEEVWA